jgi:hypothetical protein
MEREGFSGRARSSVSQAEAGEQEKVFFVFFEILVRSGFRRDDARLKPSRRICGQRS